MGKAIQSVCLSYYIFFNSRHALNISSTLYRKFNDSEIDLMPPFVLIDGSYFLFRAFHAVPDLTTSTGLHTNAIRGAMAAIQKLMRRIQPTLPCCAA